MIKDPEHLLDKGWGVKGFDDVDDKNMMLAEFQKLCEQDPVHANLVFNVMALTMLVDGKMARRELGAFHPISSVAIFVNDTDTMDPFRHLDRSYARSTKRDDPLYWKVGQ